jgi:hypothetical protein
MSHALLVDDCNVTAKALETLSDVLAFLDNSGKSQILFSPRW